MSIETQYRDVTDYGADPEAVEMMKLREFEERQVRKVEERKELMEKHGVFLPTTTLHSRKLSTLRMKELQPLLTWQLYNW